LLNAASEPLQRAQASLKMISIGLPDAQAAAICSELVVFPSRSGRRIVGFFDIPSARREGDPCVLLAPKYGETKKNCLQLAYLLAANGFSVLRFDHTFHVGESEGEMTQFSLPNAVEDLLASLDYLQQSHSAEDVIVVANSLSFRSALRAAAIDSRIARLVGLVGVVNLQHTLARVYHEDIIGTYLAGKEWGVTDILGFNIDGRIFLGTAVESGMHSLDGTLCDVRATEIPICYLYAGDDPWVRWEDVEEVFKNRPKTELIKVSGAMHELRENPKAAEGAYRQVVLACAGLGMTDPGATELIRQPPRNALFAQNKLERERLRKAVTVEQDEQVFWSGYLDKYEFLENSQEYRDYMALICLLLAPVEPRELILDVGCGTGVFGAFLLREALQAPIQQQRVTLISADLTEKGLLTASANHGRTHGMLRRPDRSAHPVNFGYATVDLDANPSRDGRILPFSDACFDSLCCSLVISYLANPEEVAAEFLRVLKPGGRLVISSLKPHCDLSAIYRGFVAQNVSEEEAQSARQLLTAAGAIKLKEEAGYYKFYSEEELAGLMAKAGFQRVQQFRSMGGQVNLVRAER
jgi:ubiquinone/menaquinone biosynthesis C-methylase UbiE/alpha-beta hydrolase superfamily lysophospholipase